MRAAVYCVVVGLAIAGCGEPAPAAPSDPASVYAGTWVGTATDSVAGQTAFRLVLSERDARLSGSWTATPSDGALTGSVSASATAIPLVLTLSCIPGGLGAITAARDGTRMTGTYFFIGCAGLGEGTIEVAKQ